MHSQTAQAGQPLAPGRVLRAARDTDAGIVIDLLRSDHHLEVAFDPRQFTVAESDGRVVACARLKPLGTGLWELASVVVTRELRGTGVGGALVRGVLGGLKGTVYALALAPGFFAGLGFRTREGVPPLLVGKATSVCAKSGFVPMELVLP